MRLAEESLVEDAILSVPEEVRAAYDGRVVVEEVVVVHDEVRYSGDHHKKVEDWQRMPADSSRPGM